MLKLASTYSVFTIKLSLYCIFAISLPKQNYHHTLSYFDRLGKLFNLAPILGFALVFQK